MNRYADAGPHRLLVAECRDRIAGYAASGKFREKPGYDTSVETSVYVHPANQRQGVGTQLYAALFSVLQAEDIHRAYAGIVLPNPGSMALHVRFAFHPIGRYTEVGRKFGRYWDIEWLERRL
jgi:phosphinothricin acetyltransferase